MRVIAGEAKGRRLIAPRGLTTRPATDRLRESVFGMLGARCEGARVLDLFAGSGALGIEALSRGAASATFVERDAAAADAMRRNLEATGFAHRATVVRGDVEAFLRGTVGAFDLVFVDPPYAETVLLSLLLAGPDLRRLSTGTVLVRAQQKHAPPVPDHWTAERERVIGDDVVRFLS